MGTFEDKKNKIVDNKAKIKQLVIEMLKESQEKALKNLDKVLDCGAIDAEAWDENNGRMLVPKAIVIALLKEEADQYSAKGTSFEKQIKKDVKNIGYFI